MKTSRFLVALGVIICLVLSPVIALMPANTAQAQPADSAWPMFGQNPQRTARSPYSGPEVPKLKWSFTTWCEVWSSPAIGAVGTIYVGSEDYNLYAIAGEYDLSISSTAGGSVTAPGEGTFTYDQGTVVDLVAEAEEGYRFVNWTGDVETIDDVNDDETTITMDGDYDIVANFAKVPIGIKDGDWIEFECILTGVPPEEPYLESMKLEFVSVEGTIATAVMTWHMSDETEESDTWSKDIASGAGMISWFVIPANLTTGDCIYLGGSEGVTIAGETTRTYAGAERTILYTSFLELGNQLTFYWDKVTGVVVEASAPLEDSTILVLKATETNMWGAKDGGCFIATAAYGTPMAEEIEILREFRDEYLLTNPLGRTLVDLYYRVSPPMAEFINEQPSLKPIVRAGLLPAVAMSAIAVNTSPAEKIAIIGLLVLVSAALAIWAKRRQGRGPQYT